MKHEPVYYTLHPDVTAFSTVRQGGYSNGLYGEMNICPYTGDAPEAIRLNRRLLADTLGISAERIVLPRQTHGTRVAVVGEENVTDSVSEEIAPGLQDTDAVITRKPGLCIGISTADCLPLLFYDPVHRAAGAAHAGWRGTVGRIAVNTLQAMGETFGTRPEDVCAVIGPGISLEAFEVGDEVYEAFAAAEFDMQRIAQRMVRQDAQRMPIEKWHIDLAACNRLQLTGAGVQEKLIITSPLCTYSHAERLFSARRLGIKSGRIFTGIVMR